MSQEEHKPGLDTWLEHRQGKARVCVPLLFPPAQGLYGMAVVMTVKVFILGV